MFASDRILKKRLAQAAEDGCDLQPVDASRGIYEFFIDGRPDSYLAGKRYRFTITFDTCDFQTPRIHDPDGLLWNPIASGSRDSPVWIGNWGAARISKILNHLTELLHHPNPVHNNWLNWWAQEQLMVQAAKEKELCPPDEQPLLREIPPDFIESVNEHYLQRKM